MQPAPRRHPVGLVVEPLGEHLRKIPYRHGAEQLRMDLCHSIRAVRTYDRQIRHPDFALRCLLHQARTLNTALVARKTASKRIEQTTINFEDDLEVARQQDFEPLERPLFERFGKESVI